MQGLVKKSLYFLLTLFVSLSAIFILIRFSPGDPVERILGPNAKQEDIFYFVVLSRHRSDEHKRMR